MRREYFRIPPEMGKDSSMQHILVHDNLVVFWIFIQFQLRQSNHVQYRNLQVSNRVNIWVLVPRRYIVAYDFLFLPTFTWLSANCRYGKFAYRGSCKQKKFWLAVLLNVNQSKKVGGRRSVEELYQALFFVSPVPPECFTERNENRAWSQVILCIALRYIALHYGIVFQIFCCKAKFGTPVHFELAYSWERKLTS